MSQTARKYVQQPEVQPSTKIIRKAKPQKQNKVPFSMLERTLFMAIVCAGVYFSVQTISHTVTVYETNHQIQNLKESIEKQTKVNADLNVQVAELSTYERILEKASKLGLTLNGDNVKVVQ